MQSAHATFKSTTVLFAAVTTHSLSNTNPNPNLNLADTTSATDPHRKPVLLVLHEQHALRCRKQTRTAHGVNCTGRKRVPIRLECR